MEGGGSRNAYARVKNQENHSITQPYRGEGGLKKSPKVPYVISERSLTHIFLRSLIQVIITTFRHFEWTNILYPIKNYKNLL